jgi:hypothetical protein
VRFSAENGIKKVFPHHKLLSPIAVMFLARTCDLTVNDLTKIQVQTSTPFALTFA